MTCRLATDTGHADSLGDARDEEESKVIERVEKTLEVLRNVSRIYDIGGPTWEALLDVLETAATCEDLIEPMHRLADAVLGAEVTRGSCDDN